KKNGEKTQPEAKSAPRKENEQAKAGGKSGEGEAGKETNKDADPNKTEKAPEAKASEAKAQQGQAKEGKEGNAGAKAGGGKEAKAEAQPGEGKENQDLEKIAELENELSKEAAALAQELEKLAAKDSRLSHNAARKASQAAGQMGAAAQALRQGNRGAAGTEGGQGLQNLDKVIAALEGLAKDQPNLRDVATEDFPKEYEALISEYLRKLSHTE